MKSQSRQHEYTNLNICVISYHIKLKYEGKRIVPPFSLVCV